MSTRNKALALACVTLLITTVSNAAPKIETPGFYIETIGLTVNEVAELDKLYTDQRTFIGLTKVAAFAFAKNVDVVFAVEKPGTVRVIVDGVTQALPVLDMSNQVSDYIDSGMGGVAVHPDFPEVKEILITYTHFAGVTPVAEGQPKYARVARLTLREEVDDLGKISYFADAPEEKDIIVGKLQATAEFPSCNMRPLGADCGAVDHAAHSFTFVHYGPDEKIYIGTGDGAGYFKPEPEALYAQLNDHLSGKVLRVNPDGSGPGDNPFFTGNKWDNASKVYAKGLRNPKSGSFDPATGKLCVGNVGWYSKEGIFCLEPGENAGWPCAENGPVANGYENTVLRRDGATLARCPLDPSAYSQPDYTYAHTNIVVAGETIPAGAVIGCTRPTADEYPDSFKGSCVFGDYVFDTIETVQFGEDSVGNPSSSLILSGAGKATDLATDRDGRVCYVAYDTGIVDGQPVSEIRCIGYDDDGTIPLLPVPAFYSIADTFDPSIVTVNASTSYHPAGADLVYSWDFGDGTTAGNKVSVEHDYETFGSFRVTLNVTTAGTNITRTTFQTVEVPDPNFVTPIKPAVQDIKFSDDQFEISSPVEFDVVVRNDLGNDSFRILANIYNPELVQVAHLELEEVFLVPAGETESISFRWPQASGLGDHTIGVEFYSEDYESWNLKYLNAATFFVRNRALASAGVTDGAGTETTGIGTDGSTDTVGTDGSTQTAGADDTAGTAGTDGSTQTAGADDSTATAGTDGSTATAGTDGSTATAGSVGETETGYNGGDPSTVAGGGGGGNGFFGCTVTSTNDPGFVLLLLSAMMMLLRRLGRGRQV